jgi:hypothetical protein
MAGSTHVDDMTESEFVAYLAHELEGVARTMNEAVDLARGNTQLMKETLVALGGSLPKPRLELVDNASDDAS